MTGIDTNILVRFLMGDDEKQANKVYSFFKNIENDKNEVFVSTLVILELIWVLESAYNITRADILDSINQLTQMPIFKFENLTILQNFIREAQQSKFDLPDLLIAHSANINGCEVIFTFDKKAAKYKLFDLL